MIMGPGGPGKLQDALASLEAANHVSPGDVDVLRELVELATELEDFKAAAAHLRAAMPAVTAVAVDVPDEHWAERSQA